MSSGGMILNEEKKIRFHVMHWERMTTLEHQVPWSCGETIQVSNGMCTFEPPAFTTPQDKQVATLVSVFQVSDRAGIAK